MTIWIMGSFRKRSLPGLKRVILGWEVHHTYKENLNQILNNSASLLNNKDMEHGNINCQKRNEKVRWFGSGR